MLQGCLPGVVSGSEVSQWPVDVGLAYRATKVSGRILLVPRVAMTFDHPYNRRASRETLQAMAEIKIARLNNRLF